MEKRKKESPLFSSLNWKLPCEISQFRNDCPEKTKLFLCCTTSVVLSTGGTLGHPIPSYPNLSLALTCGAAVAGPRRRHQAAKLNLFITWRQLFQYETSVIFILILLMKNMLGWNTHTCDFLSAQNYEDKLHWSMKPTLINVVLQRTVFALLPASKSTRAFGYFVIFNVFLDFVILLGLVMEIASLFASQITDGCFLGEGKQLQFSGFGGILGSGNRGNLPAGVSAELRLHFQSERVVLPPVSQHPALTLFTLY